MVVRTMFQLSACCERCPTAPGRCEPGAQPAPRGGAQLQRALLSAGTEAPATSPSIARPEGSLTSFSLTSDRSEVLAGKQNGYCRGLNLCAEK